MFKIKNEKRIFKITIAAMMTSLVMMMFSCSAASDELTNAENQKVEEKVVNTNNDSQQKFALYVAKNEIAQRLESDESTLWTADSKVTDLYPVYIAGVDEVAYYECKVVTNGEDAGYVLVSVTQNDILIPETAEEGLTVTEKYKEALDTNDFNVLRYDWFTSAAESKEITRSAKEGQLLASIGIFEDELVVHEVSRSTDNTSVYSEMKSNYAEEVINNGAVPPYMREDMEEYYANKEQNRGSPDYKKERTAELKHSTVRWTQSRNSDGWPCGCGNTAWAIVYAYWQQYKGKDKLFVDNSEEKKSLDLRKTSDLSDKELKELDRDEIKIYGDKPACYYSSIIEPEENYIYNAQWELFAHTNSIKISSWGFNAFWGVNPPVEKKNGLTWPRDMNKGMKYGEDRDYSMSLEWKNYGSHGWRTTTNFIYDSIKADKPAILLIATSGLIASHYVVIEKITEKYWAKTGEPVEVKLNVNYGWGEQNNRDIYSLAMNGYQKKFKVSYDVFVPTINN